MTKLEKELLVALKDASRALREYVRADSPTLTTIANLIYRVESQKDDRAEHLSSPNGCLKGCPACEPDDDTRSARAAKGRAR